VEKKLEIVPGAFHLFEESGKLQEVARLASEWFTRFLVGRTAGVKHAFSLASGRRIGSSSPALPLATARSRA
jgi:hypothetical protein